MKRVLKLFAKVLLALFVILLVSWGIVSIPALINHYVKYPALEEARSLLWTTYQQPPTYTPYSDYKGVLHSHSYWSHDSRGILKEIIPAAKQANLDFIFLSDHKRSVLDSFPRAYHGIYDQLIIEAGTESGGLMVSPMRPTVLDWKQDKTDLIHEVVSTGGLVLYVHSEEAHDWANPDYQAMEIYNIHTDLKDEEGLFSFLVNTIYNAKSYRHWAYRELFDDQTDIWALWDSLNQHRQIVGMAAVDAHENQSIRARYLEDGRVEWVGPNANTIVIREAGWKEKLLLGKADSAGWAFRWGLDTYFHSFNYVNTHILTDTFSNISLKDHLIKGHAYIAFENLAEAKGFQFFSLDQQGQLNAIMGDSIAAQEVSSLKVVSPFPVRLQLIKNGVLIDEMSELYSYEYELNGQKGNYRITAAVKLGSEWYTWVLTNPIYVF